MATSTVWFRSALCWGMCSIIHAAGALLFSGLAPSRRTG
jgi:hypothetical protein